MTQPLSDERLAEIRADGDWDSELGMGTDGRISDLLDEVYRLRARLAEKEHERSSLEDEVMTWATKAAANANEGERLRIENNCLRAENLRLDSALEQAEGALRAMYDAADDMSKEDTDE